MQQMPRVGRVALVLAQRVAFVASATGIEQLPSALRCGIDGIMLACNVVIERRIEGDLRPLVRSDGAYQLGPIGRCAERGAKCLLILRDRCDPCYGGIEARLAHLDSIDDRQRGLLLERYGPAVPELRRLVERVQNGGRIALARAPADTRGDWLALREGARPGMGGGSRGSCR